MAWSVARGAAALATAVADADADKAARYRQLGFRPGPRGVDPATTEWVRRFH
jgi:hypothetical protein